MTIPTHKPRDCPLSSRQWEVLRLGLGLGLSDEEVGSALGILRETVRTHVYNAADTLGVQGRRALVGAMERWLTRPDPEGFWEQAEHPPLTLGGRIYLQAFDRFILEKDEGSVGARRARLEMAHHVTTLALGAHANLHPHHTDERIPERLIHAICGEPSRTKRPG